MATANDTILTADHLTELACKLDDARVVLGFLTDMDAAEVAEDPDKAMSPACTAFRLVCNAIEELQAMEARA